MRLEALWLAAVIAFLSSVNKELSVYVNGAQGYFPLRELIDGRLNKATSFLLKGNRENEELL